MNRWLIVIFASLAGLIGFANPVQAAAPERVLLVYDSENIQADGQYQIDSLSRILASLHIVVQRENMSAYRSGTLTDQRFSGVITMVNWHQSRLTNAQFLRDRTAFTGKKLHIGQNLTAAEQAALGAGQILTHQQYTLQDTASGARQLLPFMSDQWSLFPATGERIGTLQQQGTDRQYAFGTIRGNQAYLPTYSASGLTNVLSTRLLAQFFAGRAAEQNPVLVLTGVTPVSNLPLLRRTTAFLRQQGIPFTVSATMTALNPELPEHSAYLRALAQVQLDGGVIFWQVPEVYDLTAQTAAILRQQFNAQLGEAIKEMVYPVGISAPGYWQFDRTFCQSLTPADQTVLLPDPRNYDLRRYAPTTTAAPLPQALAALAWAEENTMTGVEALRFAAPTALTIALPTTTKNFQALRRQVRRWPQQTWRALGEDPVARQLQGARHTVAIAAGQYTVDGQEAVLGQRAVPHAQAKRAATAASQVNAFTRWQGTVLLIFIIIALAILTAFLLYGRRIYRNQFRRKGPKP
jgi:hypothetical protein